MAEARTELASLKLLAVQRAQDKIILVDHTGGSRQTCTVAEGVALLANLVEKGAGGHMVHIVDQQAEKARKLDNPKGSTRRIFNCRTPEQYKEFNAALEPYFEEAVDPHIAIDCIIRALSAFSRSVIRGWVSQGHESERSRLPEHLR